MSLSFQPLIHATLAHAKTAVSAVKMAPPASMRRCFSFSKRGGLWCIWWGLSFFAPVQPRRVWKTTKYGKPRFCFLLLGHAACVGRWMLVALEPGTRLKQATALGAAVGGNSAMIPVCSFLQHRKHDQDSYRNLAMAIHTSIDHTTMIAAASAWQPPHRFGSDVHMS